MMPADLSILYRGALSSCNYSCDYCPFAKTTSSRQELELDAAQLERFVAWVAQRGARAGRLGILFTPWGEALIRRHYQRAFVELSHLDHVVRVAAQTNLSGDLKFLQDVRSPRVALWCTYHPEWVSMDAFLGRCEELEHYGVRYSVGVVGFPRFIDDIEMLRQRLPSGVYLWINAVKNELDRVSADVRARFSAVDPYYELNTRAWPSLGRRCHTGNTVISVRGDGVVRRCHFVPEPIGHLDDPDLLERLAPSPCTVRTCRCHIGYVHMPELGLYDVFGDGILERIPEALTAPPTVAGEKCSPVS